MSESIIDLLTEFDEMGYTPTTLFRDPEKEAKDYQKRLQNAFDEVRKETAREILNDLKGLLDGYQHKETGESLYEMKCKQFGVEVDE